MAQLALAPGDMALWHQAEVHMEDIYECEYSLFGHLGDTVLRTG